MITLFHGSAEVVDSPKVVAGRKKVDFGRGFYLTPLENQASDWARTVAERRRHGTPIVNRYEFDIEGAKRRPAMRDNVLWRKQASIILMLSKALGVSSEQALDLFYSTETYRRLMNAKTGLQLMSDGYVVDDALIELLPLKPDHASLPDKGLLK